MDPLVDALPPATDYLSYLTLLEYQLTPARLPTLHSLLQDESLTTNIGWDLVQLLLPMLPQSLECLQDVARLGNPREVILRVSDALLQLEPDEEDEPPPSIDPAATSLESQFRKTVIASDQSESAQSLPRHVIQFNCLVTMLSVLHSRIQTKYPSRFIAASLQATLEAYSRMPTSETTLTLLEFFRDVSPSKRPAPPPRAASESSVVRVSAASAPDPEAEVQSSDPSPNDDRVLVKKFLQFGLIELLKSYLLSLSGPADPGMSWAVRLQEKLHPETVVPRLPSQTDSYANDKRLRERDMIIAKITVCLVPGQLETLTEQALSRDFDLDNERLRSVVSVPAESQPPPLDFDEPPMKPEDIPLERHGALLLLTARGAMAELFSQGQEISSIPVFPDLARIFSNFVGGPSNPITAVFEQPSIFLDSLLTLSGFSTENSIGTPKDDEEFKDFTLALTACTTSQNYNSIRQLSTTVVHSHPSQVTRYRLIRKVLEDDSLHPIKESAVAWLKHEILDAAGQSSESSTSNIFLNPHYFSVLLPSLFNSSDLFLNVTSDIVTSWLKFSQSLVPPLHAALSLVYILISSPTLREQLQLEKSYLYLRRMVLEPLKSLCHAFETNLTQNGGDGRIEAAVDMWQVGMSRSVGLISHVLGQVEDATGDAFVSSDAELQEPTADDLTRVEAIRKETAP